MIQNVLVEHNSESKDIIIDNSGQIKYTLLVEENEGAASSVVFESTISDVHQVFIEDSDESPIDIVITVGFFDGEVNLPVPDSNGLILAGDTDSSLYWVERYTHPVYSIQSANAIAGQVIDTFSSDSKGHVTDISLRYLTADDIPNLPISKITSLQTELNNRYTETELQTSGSSSVHWDNITNIPDTITGIHADLDGLDSDDHSQYLLLSGRTGQTINDNITLDGNLLLDSNFGFSTAGVTNIDRILDEDSFISNSATGLATQQSIKAYVDNAVVGYEWIVASVVAATTGNITISTDLNNGDIIDGVTLSTGDYVLVKDQTDKTENGLYEVGATPGRASEMDAAGEFKSKAMLVTGGTVNGGSSWVCTTTVTTLGTDDIEFSKLSQSTSYSEGTGIDITGPTISLDHLGIEDLTDPAADRIMFWDDSENAVKWLTVDSTLSINGAILSASLSNVNYWTKSGDNLNYADGNVSVGTATDYGSTLNIHGDLYIRGSDYSGLRIYEGSGGYYERIIDYDAASEGSNLYFDADGNRRVTLLNNGNVGINKTSPAYKLDVTGTGRFTSTVTATNFILSSDIKLKENINKLNDSTDIISFNFKNDDEKRKRYGIIAQEIEKNNPELVYEDKKGYKQVAYIDYLLMKMAEKDKQIAELQGVINKD